MKKSAIVIKSNQIPDKKSVNGTLEKAFELNAKNRILVTDNKSNEIPTLFQKEIK